MQKVLQALPAVSFLLGEQRVEEAIAYRRASFCVLCKEGGNYIAYNTLTGVLAELDAAEAQLLDGAAHDFCEASEELVKLYFLVPEGHDDIKLCNGIRLFAIKAGEAPRPYHNFTVFTTTDCNARCFYCYEHGIARTYMSEDTAMDTAAFIIASSKKEKVEITWYGGEPLMNSSAIDTVSAALSDAGVNYGAILATNASLLNDEMIERAVNLWHVGKVQVTLDGTRDVYNRIKCYADGRENAFEDVLCNIEKLLDKGIKVNIRLNIEEHNIADMYALADVLIDRFSGRKGLNVYSALLFDCEGAKRPATTLTGRTELARQVIEIEDKLSLAGVLHPRRLRRSLAYCYCKADSADSIVITAEGKLVKCDFFTDKHLVGDVKSGIDSDAFDEEKAYFSKHADGYKYCIGCSAYPVCLRLANCPTSGGVCDEARRYLTEERLIRSVRYAYAKAKEESE